MLAHLVVSLRAVKPEMALLARSVVDAIALVGGPVGSAEVVAKRLGLPNRFALARMLHREGLPPLHRLGAWATVLSWLEANERDGASLCRLAYRSGRYPAACYRLVREVTGTTWENVRKRGLGWAAREFLKEIVAISRERSVGAQSVIAAPRLPRQRIPLPHRPD